MEQAEEYGHCMGELKRVGQEAKLKKLQAVAEEARKWEA